MDLTLSPTDLDPQELFKSAVVEAVTGTKQGTLRQWEAREIYYCELRKAAYLQASTIQAPDWPERIPNAIEILKQLEKGWRAYTLGDLIRISYISELMKTGVEARAAGRAAMSLHLPESNANCVPSGRKLLILQNNPRTCPDEFALYSDSLFQFRQQEKPSRINKTSNETLIWGLKNELRTLKFMLDKISDSVANRPGVLLNLSRLKRDVLNRLEQYEQQETTSL